MAGNHNSGRKAKPLKTKVLKGTVNVTREAQRGTTMEVERLKEIPTPPESFGDRAKAIWFKNCKILLDIDMLYPTDLDLLEAYCLEFEKYFIATADVNKRGMVLKSKGIERINPNMKTADQALGRVLNIVSHFGFSPSARTRISMSQLKKVNPKDALFEL